MNLSALLDHLFRSRLCADDFDNQSRGDRAQIEASIESAVDTTLSGVELTVLDLPRRLKPQGVRGRQSFGANAQPKLELENRLNGDERETLRAARFAMLKSVLGRGIMASRSTRYDAGPGRANAN